MMAQKISRRVMVDRLAWVERMTVQIRALPLDDRVAFFADLRNVWTVESCLRRALEALFDSGRHILAKRFASGVTEYKQIASELQNFGVLSPAEAATLRILAGYRNRMVHFYHEVEPDELYEIARTHLSEVMQLASALTRWLEQYPEAIQDDL
jgi:uncharacterized protein YutE (UPF0331/DUF86 family)